MRRRSLTAALVLVLSAAVPGLAAAADAFTTGSVNMRTGPGTAYPVVTTLPPGAPVNVVGCTSGWSWCDTAWGSSRGWVSASYLQVTEQGAVVPFPAYAPRVAVPVVVYSGPVYRPAYPAYRPVYPAYAAPPRAYGRSVYVGPNHACYRGPHAVACR